MSLIDMHLLAEMGVPMRVDQCRLGVETIRGASDKGAPQMVH